MALDQGCHIEWQKLFIWDRGQKSRGGISSQRIIYSHSPIQSGVACHLLRHQVLAVRKLPRNDKSVKETSSACSLLPPGTCVNHSLDHHHPTSNAATASAFHTPVLVACRSIRKNIRSYSRRRLKLQHGELGMLPRDRPITQRRCRPHPKTPTLSESLLTVSWSKFPHCTLKNRRPRKLIEGLVVLTIPSGQALYRDVLSCTEYRSAEHRNVLSPKRRGNLEWESHQRW